MRPTHLPSLLPTAPTFEPTVGATEPSSRPSASPSSPTIAPSEAPVLPSVAPSCEPTEPPTVSPTHEPSEQPTVVPTVFTSGCPSVLPSVLPSIEPSAAPSVLQITRRPFLIPSVAPTVYVTPPPYQDISIVVPAVLANSTVTPVVVYNRTTQNYNFIINVSANVFIVDEGGADKFTVYPQSNVTLTIAYFNLSSDVIDLTAFAPTLASFDDLTITAGSAIVSLPELQRIRILNLQPSDLAAGHFVFGAGADDDGDAAGVATRIITIATLSVGLLVIVVCAFTYVAHKRAIKKTEQECELLVQEIIKRREGLISLNRNNTNRNSVCILTYTSRAGKEGSPRNRSVSWDTSDGVSHVDSDNAGEGTDVVNQRLHRSWNASFDAAEEVEFEGDSDISLDSDLSYEFRKHVVQGVNEWRERLSSHDSPLLDARVRSRTISGEYLGNRSGSPRNKAWSGAEVHQNEYIWNNYDDGPDYNVHYDVEQHHHTEDHWLHEQYQNEKDHYHHYYQEDHYQSYQEDHCHQDYQEDHYHQYSWQDHHQNDHGGYLDVEHGGVEAWQQEYTEQTYHSQQQHYHQKLGDEEFPVDEDDGAYYHQV